MKKTLLTIVVSVTLSVFGSAFVLAPSASQNIGGLVHNVMEDFSAGISVDGSTVISGSGDLLSLGDLSVTDDSIVSDDLIVGGTTASGSSLVAEFLATATVSVGFDGGSGKGTCLEMVNTAGTRTYVRIVGTTVTANTTSCK